MMRRLNPCPLPVHDFVADGAPRSMQATCAACGSVISADAARWYLAGVRDALEGDAKAKRVADARREIAARDRARKRGPADAAAAAEPDADDGELDAASEVFDDASR